MFSIGLAFYSFKHANKTRSLQPCASPTWGLCPTRYGLVFGSIKAAPRGGEPGWCIECAKIRDEKNSLRPVFTEQTQRRSAEVTQTQVRCMLSERSLPPWQNKHVLPFSKYSTRSLKRWDTGAGIHLLTCGQFLCFSFSNGIKKLPRPTGPLRYLPPFLLK